MIHTNTHSYRGFTLIETILYIALFSILIGGGITTTYSLIESSKRSQTETLLTDESIFIFSKIHWLISQTETIHIPIPNTSSPSLILVPWNTNIGNVVKVTTTGTHVSIQKDTESEIPLNSSDTQISELNFTFFSPTETNTEPESITITFTLSARTQNGSLLSEHFQDIIYTEK